MSPPLILDSRAAPISRRAEETLAEIQPMLRWVLGPQVREPSGAMRSWFAAEGPGFRYAEATAYAVRVLLDLERRLGRFPYRTAAIRSGRALFDDRDPSGGFGRKRVLYSFDTGICAAALRDAAEAALGRAHGETNGAELLDAARASARFLRARLADRLGAVVAANGGSVASLAFPRWSVRFGPHLLKVLPVLVRADRLGWIEGGEALAEEIEGEQVAAHFRDGRFSVSGDGRAVYVHAHCYAVEGWIALASERGGARGNWPSGIRDALVWLESLQGDDGGLPNWVDAPGERSFRVADATAQAVRLWSLIDAERFAAAIEKGIEFLKSLGASVGAVRYSTEHGHHNTWATLFAIQAFLLARLGPAPDPIA